MQFIKTFSEIGIEDLPLVGGKNASLGEMYSRLATRGVRIPNGYAVTAEAYRAFIGHNKLEESIRTQLKQVDVDDVDQLFDISGKIRASIVYAQMPQQLQEQIIAAYEGMEKEYGAKPDVAVRSSATAEDLPDASFAGQQDTYLNISGTRNLLATCRMVFASLFTERAISYRRRNGFDDAEVALSIAVQKMVRSDLASAGVAFTLDTESGFREAVLITSGYGLGETVVNGTVNPDEFYVFKSTFKKGFKPILKRSCGSKESKMIYGHEQMAGVSTRVVPVHPEDRKRFSISDDEVLEIADYAIKIEEMYSEQRGRPSPMDIEWAKDGVDGLIYVVQARPETVQSKDQRLVHKTYNLSEPGRVLTTGRSVGRQIACGKVRVIVGTEDMNQLQQGEVLVTEITDPDWEPVMKRASAIVTDRGGRTCHAAIISREMGIPAIVGCGTATRDLHEGARVTVSCAEGDQGRVYEGELKYEVDEIQLNEVPQSKTKVMLNIGDPERAFELGHLPTDGVGLVRLEFIINNSIRVHPRALLEYPLVDAELKRDIERITSGYSNPASFFIERLAEGIGMIAAAFYPRPIIVRFSDFKSNEYASLLGGQAFEPVEENPMLGFRGAARYYSAGFAKCFALECHAISKVRDELGLDNVAVMMPFVRTPDEGRKVLALMEEQGLARSDTFKVYLMCELPSNVIRADEFLEDFDGFSIGSNDLTQLVLGVDRDSTGIAGIDERDPAVLDFMGQAIEACLKKGKYIGICGQSPSDFPEVTRFLVSRGIESISLNPDSLLTMKSLVAEVEQENQAAGKRRVRKSA